MAEIQRLDLIRFRVLYIPVGVEHPHYPAVKEEKPLVEFYDKFYDHTPDGQFTGGRYFAETLLEDSKRLRTVGLSLYGDVPAWVIFPSEMNLTINWIENCQKEEE
jgi:hypothetical protein